MSRHFKTLIAFALLLPLLLTGCLSEGAQNADATPSGEAPAAPAQTLAEATQTPGESPQGSPEASIAETPEASLDDSPEASSGASPEASSQPTQAQSQKAAATTKPTPAKAQTPTPDKSDYVTVAVGCKNARKGWDQLKQSARNDKVVPKDGVIISGLKVEFKQGDTAYTALERACRERKIPMSHAGSGADMYVSGINSLFEFDGGPQAGWLYSVNGDYPGYSSSRYKLKAGDRVRFDYTLDQGEDLGSKR